MTHSTSYYDVRDALSQPGCPICRLNVDTAERYLDGLLWELVNDSKVREKIRKAQGFCNLHGWRMARIHGSALGVAIINQDVLNTLLETLTSASANGSSPLQAVRHALGGERASAPDAIADRLEPRGECPACARVRGAEDRYLRVLVDNLSRDEALHALFHGSEGLCQVHFRAALRQAENEQEMDALVNAQRAIWERLNAQLGEFIRKNDYRFAGEPMGEERDAWLRSIGALSGATS